jgi:hypothetical protein
MKKALLIVMACGLFLAAEAQKQERALTRSEELNRAYCRGLFASADGTFFDMMDPKVSAGSQGFMNILDFLEGRVPNLTLKKGEDFLRVPYIRGNRASIFLNEIPINPGMLTGIPITDVAMIKVIRGPFAGGAGSATGGAVAIYTINSDSEE